MNKEKVFVVGEDSESTVTKLQKMLGEDYNSYEFTYVDTREEVDSGIKYVDYVNTEPSQRKQSSPKSERLMSMLLGFGMFNIMPMDFALEKPYFEVGGSSRKNTKKSMLGSVKEVIKRDGSMHFSTKVNRNATCTCGSGKKYKKCCISK